MTIPQGGILLLKVSDDACKIGSLNENLSVSLRRSAEKRSRFYTAKGVGRSCTTERNVFRLIAAHLS